MVPSDDDISVGVSQAQGHNHTVSNTDDDDFSALDKLNVIIPVGFGLLLWVSVGLLYPLRGLLSLLTGIPLFTFIVLRIIKQCFYPSLQSQSWGKIMTWFGIGLFTQVVVLSLQLLMLFAISVIAYGVILNGAWDSQIHGYGDMWQYGDSFFTINVFLSVIASFTVFAPFTELAKYFLAKSIPSSESVLTISKYLELCLLSGIGLGAMEALVFILIVGELRYALLQVFICSPLHILTMCAISMACAKHESASKTLLVPIFVQACQHLQAYIVVLTVEDEGLALSLYLGISLFLIICYGIYAYVFQFKPLSHTLFVIGEDVDINTIEVDLRIEMSQLGSSEKPVTAMAA